ncbi:hypothetical protein GUJ93_ZPchr0004g40327 [Zizania palustris]|uniref:Uncharacterized protein n=1 Tax=Zizania palustris TaxID=103762 RepID=A0A8J5SL75_ZIZPA|nr:hypothetical protein GUJ93_ZPchr0004g40327 [Zizania palustris]
MEAEHSGPEVEATSSKPRAVATYSEAEVPEPTSTSVDFKGSQVHGRAIAEEVVDAYFDYSEELVRSDFVAQLSHNTHGDLLANAQETLLQAFALTRSVVTSIGRREAFMMVGVEKLQLQASEAAQRQRKAEDAAEAPTVEAARVTEAKEKKAARGCR